MSSLRLGRVFMTGLGVFLIVLLLVNVVVSIYAMGLGFGADGGPSPERIDAFAAAVTPWLSGIAGVLVTLAAAWWTAARVPDRPALHGFLLAAVAVLLGVCLDLIRSALGRDDLVAGAAMLLVGWVGGNYGTRRRGSNVEQ